MEIVKTTAEVTLEPKAREQPEVLLTTQGRKEMKANDIQRGEIRAGARNIKGGRTYALAPTDEDRWIGQLSSVEDEKDWPEAMKN